MSMHPQPMGPVPEDTARVARAAFPKGDVYVQVRYVLGTIFFAVDEWVLLDNLEDSSYGHTLAERREFLQKAAGVRVSESTVSRMLRRLGWSRKKGRWVRARETSS